MVVATVFVIVLVLNRALVYFEFIQVQMFNYILAGGVYDLKYLITL